MLQDPEVKPKRTCTVDRDRFAVCSLVIQDMEIPPEYQYFNDYGQDLAPLLGSSFTQTDFCPYEDPNAVRYDMLCNTYISYLSFSRTCRLTLRLLVPALLIFQTPMLLVRVMVQIHAALNMDEPGPELQLGMDLPIVILE